MTRHKIDGNENYRISKGARFSDCKKTTKLIFVDILEKRMNIFSQSSMNHEVDDSDVVGEMKTSKCYDGCNFLWDYDYLVGNLDFINKNVTNRNL